MALKRKRSSPTFSSPFADTTTTTDFNSPSSLPFFYTQSKPTEPLYHKPTWSFPTYESDDSHDYHVSSQHLNSRTRKRHRDNRPDERAIFANTISKLFEAQRNFPNAEPVVSQPSANTKVDELAQRRTLHSFWKIGGGALTRSVPMAVDSGASSTSSLQMRCDDCDGVLRSGEAMELDDEVMEQETACASCRRSVCDTCAVLGDTRICLACANWSGR